LGCWHPQQQLQQLATHRVAHHPHTKQRKYINALVTAHVIEIEQDFVSTKKGRPN